MQNINLLAVIVAALIPFVVGYAWYGPVFGQQWMDLIGIKKADRKKEKKSGMEKTMTLTLLSNLALSYVLAHFLRFTGSTNIADGMIVAYWAWFGFTAATQVPNFLYEKKPLKLMLIHVGYNLVCMLLMGVLLMIWK